MRILAAAVFIAAVTSHAEAADLSYPYPGVVIEEQDVVVRPVRRVIKARYTCVRCTRLPLGGLREPVVAHVPLGGLRKACPPAVEYTVQEDVVLRVKG